MPDESNPSIGDFRPEVLSRIREQARSHWHELSIIVASANAVSAVLLLVNIVSGDFSLAVVMLSWGILIAALMCAMLAYYSLQIGSLLTFGLLRPIQVFTAFAIAASQLAVFLYPSQVLGEDGPKR